MRGCDERPSKMTAVVTLDVWECLMLEVLGTLWEEDVRLSPLSPSTSTTTHENLCRLHPHPIELDVGLLATC